MKKYISLLTFFVVALVFSSCDKSDPEPDPHIVGLWELEGIEYSNLPASYSYMDGLSFNVGVIFTRYTLEILNDNTFILRITPTSGTSQNEQGTWSMDDNMETLTLDYGDDIIEDWEIKKDELDQLWISTPSQDLLPSNAAMDGLVANNEEIADLNEAFSYIFGSTITDEEFDDLTDPVVLDVDYLYIRSTEQ